MPLIPQVNPLTLSLSFTHSLFYSQMCACTWEDITPENYVEYQTHPSMTWHASGYCEEIVRRLRSEQFPLYLAAVEKAAQDCAAAVRRLVRKGPPLYLEDANALKLPDGDTHVCQLWFASSDTEESAKLESALEGEAREALWDAQKETLAAMEAAEAVAGKGGEEEEPESTKE